MNQIDKRKKLRATLKWILWVILVQIVLINITAILYAYKLTHFYEPSPTPLHASKNIFTKTWKLFTGPKFKKSPITEVPHFPYETVQLITHDSIKLESWYLPVDSSKGTALLFHGLGSNKGSMLEEAYEFRYMGYNVMLVDLRAHGNSGGHTTTAGVFESEDVKLAFAFIEKKGEKNIILYGLSLGAVVIAKSIYDYGISPSHIIMDAPFESLKAHLRGRARVLGFPEEPFATLVTFWSGIERDFNGFKHNTCRYAGKINCPVLMQYGVQDKWVLPEETKDIFESIASKNKKLVIYQNADHGAFLQNDPMKWRNEMKIFLN
jgi:alpha-beta hydrolase superfamily lysophospholipase